MFILRAWNISPAVKSVWFKQGELSKVHHVLPHLDCLNYLACLHMLSSCFCWKYYSVWFNIIHVLTRRDVLVQSVVNQVVVLMKTCFLTSFWKEEAYLDKAVAKILVSPNISHYQRQFAKLVVVLYVQTTLRTVFYHLKCSRNLQILHPVGQSLWKYAQSSDKT